MPAYGPDIPATAWKLSSQGWSEARALPRALPVDAVLIASREPKARQTLEPAGPTQTLERFNEVTRDEPYEATSGHADARMWPDALNSASMHRRHRPTEREGRPATARDLRQIYALDLGGVGGLTNNSRLDAVLLSGRADGD
jgi:hypothetical protein